LNNKTGIDLELLTVYSKYELIDILKNEHIFKDSISSNIPELSGREISRLSKMLIRDEIELISPAPSIPSGSDIINTIRTYSYELSEVLKDDLMSVLFSRISLKDEPTINDAKLVLTVYRSINLNQKNHNSDNVSDPLLTFQDWVNKS
jgi:hypothetical protein